MRDALLTLNAGSSSLKFALFADGSPLELVVRGQLAGIPDQPRFTASDAQGNPFGHGLLPGGRVEHRDAIVFVLDWARQRFADSHRVVAVGHRVVHGGARFADAVRVDRQVLEALRALVPLAPLHQPHNLETIETVLRLAPDLPQVACFDTAFHRTQPAVAQAMGLPRAFAARGLRRYGFHGLSYEYVASVLVQHDPRAAAGRAVVAHLGNGASLCALRAGRSVATTMGFSTLDGLLMGTRPGSLDPGVLLYLMQQEQLDTAALERLLYRQSGLLGVSGISADMRELLASPAAEAKEAIELFVYRVGRELGSLAAALGGLDALVFTGGIGEHAVAIRARVCASAGWLGVELDAASNAAGGPRISRAGSPVTAWVLPTDEERMIAQHVRRVCREPGPVAGEG